MGTDIRRVSAVIEVYKRAEAYAMPAEQANGMDVLEMYEATQRLSKRVRTEGPAFLEAITYRYRGHSMADPELYRRKGETERWKELDPIKAFRERLERDGVLAAGEFDALQAEIESTVNEATQFAEESPKPAPDALTEFVYKEPE
jgi:pyruvate dehydrogenase E1 component alpha subunit